MPGLTLDDFSDAYTRWALQRCPCCGGEICAWYWQGQDHEPRAIGEGVVMCGRCIGNEHHNLHPNFTRLMLQAIALGARKRNGRR